MQADFKPTLMNSVVFITTTFSGVVTFGNNYQGAPWMTSLTANKPLCLCLVGLATLLLLAASEAVPGLSEWFELVALPDREFKGRVFTIMGLNFAGVVVWEHLMRAVFQWLPERRRTKAARRG